MISFIRAALAGALLLLAPALASAAYSCSVSSGGFSAA